MKLNYKYDRERYLQELGSRDIDSGINNRDFSILKRKICLENPRRKLGVSKNSVGLFYREPINYLILVMNKIWDDSTCLVTSSNPVHRLTIQLVKEICLFLDEISLDNLLG